MATCTPAKHACQAWVPLLLFVSCKGTRRSARRCGTNDANDNNHLSNMRGCPLALDRTASGRRACRATAERRSSSCAASGSRSGRSASGSAPPSPAAAAPAARPSRRSSAAMRLVHSAPSASAPARRSSWQGRARGQAGRMRARRHAFQQRPSPRACLRGGRRMFLLRSPSPLPGRRARPRRTRPDPTISRARRLPDGAGACPVARRERGPAARTSVRSWRSDSTGTGAAIGSAPQAVIPPESCAPALG